MTVGARKILGPVGDTDVPVQVAAPIAVDAAFAGRIHEAGESELGLFLVVGGQRNIADAVLHAVEFAERALEGEQYAGQCQTACQHRRCLPDVHPSALLPRISRGGDGHAVTAAQSSKCKLTAFAFSPAASDRFARSGRRTQAAFGSSRLALAQGVQVQRVARFLRHLSVARSLSGCRVPTHGDTFRHDWEQASRGARQQSFSLPQRCL